MTGVPSDTLYILSMSESGHLGERHQARRTGAGLAAGDMVEGDCTLLGRGVAVGVTWLFTSASVFSPTRENGSG